MGRVVALRKARRRIRPVSPHPRLSLTSAEQIMFHRNQREAGIEHLEWESRLRPLKSWLRLAGELAAAAAGLSTIILLARFI